MIKQPAHSSLILLRFPLAVSVVTHILPGMLSAVVLIKWDIVCWNPRQTACQSVQPSLNCFFEFQKQRFWFQAGLRLAHFIGASTDAWVLEMPLSKSELLSPLTLFVYVLSFNWLLEEMMHSNPPPSKKLIHKLEAESRHSSPLLSLSR